MGGIAAQYFQNHPERAVFVMTPLGYMGGLSISPFNRRLHAVRDWLYHLFGSVAEVYAQGEVFIIDRMPTDLPFYRKSIEVVYSQLYALGIQHFHAPTNAGFDLKTWPSLFALALTNMLAA